MTRVLIIDDEPLVRTTLRQTLELAGFEVLEAANGKDGVEVARQNAFDLIVTDIIMPEKEGVETILQLRRMHPDLKIIAISGGGRVGNLDFLEMADNAGADRILAKPFDPDDFLEVVQTVIGASAGGGASSA